MNNRFTLSGFLAVKAPAIGPPSPDRRSLYLASRDLPTRRFPGSLRASEVCKRGLEGFRLTEAHMIRHEQL